MRILVVEDDEKIANAIDAGLTAEGFDVDVAHDGDAGLSLARGHRYGVIVLDIMLPKRNGYLITAALRADGNDTPILMLTAKSGEYDEAEALDTGADDYLTKPFSFVVLAAHVRALLRRSSTRVETDVISVGDLDLDRGSHRVRRGDQEISLTGREFSMLETLAINSGQVCERDYLLDQVWGPHFDGGSNVVEAYVSYLRRKLANLDAHNRIKTVRGVGYQLTP